MFRVSNHIFQEIKPEISKIEPIEDHNNDNEESGWPIYEDFDAADFDPHYEDDGSDYEEVVKPKISKKRGRPPGRKNKKTVKNSESGSDFEDELKTKKDSPLGKVHGNSGKKYRGQEVSGNVINGNSYMSRCPHLQVNVSIATSITRISRNILLMFIWKWSEIKKILRVVTHKIAHFVEKFCSIENSKAGINVLRFIKPKLTTERPKMMKPKLNWRGKSMKRKLMIKIPRMELSSYVICVESIVHQNPA